MKSPLEKAASELSGSLAWAAAMSGAASEPSVPPSVSACEAGTGREVPPTLRSETASRTRTVVCATRGSRPSAAMVTLVWTGGT